VSLLNIHIKNVAGWCKLLLLMAAIIWGFGFVAMKDVVTLVPPAWLLAIRFMLTGAILTLVFLKKMRLHFNRDHIVFGLILGVMLFLAFWVQTVGLVYTTPGKNAFLTASYVVMVPFIYWAVARKRPTVFNITAAMLCIIGMALVSLLESLTFGLGEILTIVSAMLFALHMVYVAKWSNRCDVLVLTVYQFIVAGICSIIFGIFLETPPTLAVLLEPSILLNMGYLIVFASCLALVFQNFSLKYVPPAQASLFLSLEAVFGVIFSVLVYGEILNLRLVLGFCLIFLAIVVSETFPLKEVAWRKKARESFGNPEAKAKAKAKPPDR